MLNGVLVRLLRNAIRFWRRFRTNQKRAYLIGLWLVGAVLPVKNLSLVPIWMRDFLNYWLAPRALWSGVNPYDVTAYRTFGLGIFPAANPNQFNFTYPPHSLFLFSPFALLPPFVALALWDISSLFVFYLAARPLVPKGLPTFIAVLTPATLICIQWGQTGLFAAALFLAAFRGGSLSAAALTFKPQVGFLAALGLLQHSRKAFLIALIATISLAGVSEVAFGYWSDFLYHVIGYQGKQLAHGSEVVWVLFGTTPMIGYGFKGFIIYGTASAIVVSRNFNVFTAATATFLISPYGFHYDMSVVCLGFVVLLYSYWDKMQLWKKLVASLAFLTPVIVNYGTWGIPPILLLGLFIQTQCFPGVQLAWKGRRIAILPVNQPEPA